MTFPHRGGPPNRGIKAMQIQRPLERLRLHHIGMHRRAMRDRTHPCSESFLMNVDNQVQPVLLHQLIAKSDHLAELPGGIDMQQRKRKPTGIERLLGKVQHHRAVLANRVHHHWVFALCDDLAQDVNALCFKSRKMGQCHGFPSKEESRFITPDWKSQPVQHLSP